MTFLTKNFLFFLSFIVKIQNFHYKACEPAVEQVDSQRHLNSGNYGFCLWVLPLLVWIHIRKEKQQKNFPESSNIKTDFQVRPEVISQGSISLSFAVNLLFFQSDNKPLSPIWKAHYWLGMMGKDNAPFSAQLLMNCSAVVEASCSYSCMELRWRLTVRSGHVGRSRTAGACPSHPCFYQRDINFMDCFFHKRFIEISITSWWADFGYLQLLP